MRLELTLGFLLISAGAEAGIIADYASPVLNGKGQFDSTGTVDRVADLHAGAYFFLVHSEADWSKLTDEFLPAAAERKIDVWTYFVPPSECPASCNLPFGKDYIRIAAGVAELSLKYPNLKGLAIDDFMDNVTLFTPEYVARMRAAGREINPKFQFFPLLYWRSMTPQVLDRYGPAIDGVIFAYRDEPTINTHRNISLRDQLDRAEQLMRERGKALLLMIYCAPLGRIPIPPDAEYVAGAVKMALHDISAGNLAGVVTYKLRKSGQPAPAAENYSHSGNGRATILASGVGLKAGDYGELSCPISHSSGPSTITFWRTAYYAKLPAGYFFLQVLLDDRVIWDQDVSSFESGVWKQERIEGGDAGSMLRLRLAVKRNTGSIAAIVGVDDVAGLSVADPGFENPASWTMSQTGPALMPMVQVFDPLQPARMFDAVRALYEHAAR